MEPAFLQAILDRPAELANWLVLADWLEEDGQADRAELVRLQVQLRHEPERRARTRPERRARALLAAGVRPAAAVVTNSLGMRLVLVPPGSFWMGSLASRSEYDGDEVPCRYVTLSRPFYLGEAHVTQDQYEAVMGSNPSHFGPSGEGAKLVSPAERGRLPVETVSYRDVTAFCRRLSARPEEKKAGRSYRLPTEAEWEYACRGGICQTAYHVGSRLTGRDARFSGRGGRPKPIASYRPNLFGLHDMHGNVWEWCADWYDERYYRDAPAADPAGPEAGLRRVLRGGGWSTPASLCRSALRGHNTLDARHNYNGLRVAMSVAG